MKIIITEEQLRTLLTEQTNTSIVKLGCNALDKVGEYCGSLKMTKEHGDIIIKNNREKAKKDLIERLDLFIASAKKESGEYKKITDKFTQAVEKVKSKIISQMDAYYPYAVYSSVGVQNPLDTNKIMDRLLGILYESFNEVWNESGMMRTLASTFVTKKNIKNVKLEAKNIWDKWINKFGNLMQIYFVMNLTLPGRKLTHELSKNATTCKKVIITQTDTCKDLPRNEWYNPKMTYSWEFPLTKSPSDSSVINSVSSNYWTKIEGLLNSLV